MPEVPVVAPSTPVWEPANAVLKVFHIVVEGDTFSSIAADYLGDVKLNGKIAEANPKVNPDRMRIGMKIVIPRL